MQSFLQFRKIGLSVRKQIERDHEKANFRSTKLPRVPEDSSQDTSPRDVNQTDETHAGLHHLGTIQTQYSLRTALGHTLTGVHARERTTHEGKGEKVFVVDWEGKDDPLNPRHWSVAHRVCTTLIVGSIAFVVSIAASADTAILPQAAAEFGVSDVVESLAIGMFLI